MKPFMQTAKSAENSSLQHVGIVDSGNVKSIVCPFKPLQRKEKGLGSNKERGNSLGVCSEKVVISTRQATWNKNMRK